MPTLPCSADDKNEIRGSHIDNPDAEREDTNNAQTRPRFFTPLSCLSLRSMEARGHHAKPSGRTLSPPLPHVLVDILELGAHSEFRMPRPL